MSSLTKKSAVVIGASAGVGRATSEEFAAGGYDLLLVARASKDLEAVASDLRLRFHVSVQTLGLDLALCDFRPEILKQKVEETCVGLTAVVFTAGSIEEVDDSSLSAEKLQALFQINQINLIKCLQAFITQYQDTTLSLIVCSSIAAAVPRSRNMAYSAAKAALESYCRSLQHSTVNSGIGIEILRLGYVDTAMSFGKKLLFPVVSPQQVARSIFSRREKLRRLRYYPCYWRVIVLILQALPWKIYAKLKF